MKFLQVSDVHMIPEGEVLYGLDPAKRLTACIADINRHHADAELVVVTGDLAHTGDPRAYHRLRGLLAGLAVPYKLLIGNHDNREHFKSVFPDAERNADGFVQYGIDTSAGRFICLDTNVPGEHFGGLCNRRLAWLRDELARSRGKPIYLFMHHPPFRVGLKKMDSIWLRDGETLGALIDEAGPVKHLFFGHLHRPLSGSWRGIPFANLPSTVHQVALDFVMEDDVPGSHEAPAYSVIFAEPQTTLVHLRAFLDDTATFVL
jgi:3',5'-cyclic-AMP phosphodiesterase